MGEGRLLCSELIETDRRRSFLCYSPRRSQAHCTWATHENTMMAVLTRYKRMCGFRTCGFGGWIRPASQLSSWYRATEKEGMSRHDLVRESLSSTSEMEQRASPEDKSRSRMRREGASVDGRASSLRWMKLCRALFGGLCGFTKKDDLSRDRL